MAVSSTLNDDVLAMIVNNLDADRRRDRLTLQALLSANTQLFHLAARKLYSGASLIIHHGFVPRTLDSSDVINQCESCRPDNPDNECFCPTVITRERLDACSKGRDDERSRKAWRWRAYLGAVGKLVVRTQGVSPCDLWDAATIAPFLGSNFKEVVFDLFDGPGCSAMKHDWVRWLLERWEAKKGPSAVGLYDAPPELAHAVLKHPEVKHLMVNGREQAMSYLMPVLAKVKRGFESITLGDRDLFSIEEAEGLADDETAPMTLPKYLAAHMDAIQSISFRARYFEYNIPDGMPIKRLTVDDLETPLNLMPCRSTLQSLDLQLTEEYEHADEIFRFLPSMTCCLSLTLRCYGSQYQRLLQDTLPRLKWLQRLDVFYDGDGDFDFEHLLCNLAHLEHLAIDYSALESSASMIDFGAIIDHMPRLHSLSLRIVRRDRKPAFEIPLLPRMESLKVSYGTVVVDEKALAIAGMPDLEVLEIESPKVVKDDVDLKAMLEIDGAAPCLEILNIAEREWKTHRGDLRPKQLPTVLDTAHVNMPDRHPEHLNGTAADVREAVAAHLKLRQSLVDRERDLRLLRPDGSPRIPPTELALAASAKFASARSIDHREFWSVPGNDVPDSAAAAEAALDDSLSWPGMNFHLARDQIQRTRLFAAVRRMPKGLLHAHLEAMIDVRFLLELAVGHEAEKDGDAVMHFSSSEPLTSGAALDKANVMFSARVPESTSPAADAIYSPSYKAGAWVPAKATAAAFPAGLFSERLGKQGGGKQEFVGWLVSRTTIAVADMMKHHEGEAEIWAKFSGIFMILAGITYFEPFFRLAMQHIFTKMAEDCITHAEIRLAMEMTFTARDGRVLPVEDVISTFGEEVDRFKALHASSSPSVPFWGARLIWTTIRSFPSPWIRANMLKCIEAIERYPHVIAGFDLVGHEDPGRSLRSHLPDLLWFRQECASRGLDVPLLLHAGETNGDGTEADDNLYDAVALGSPRIGHGYSLARHPVLMEEVRLKGVCIEVCPISNEVLRLTSTVRGHPIVSMLAHGVDVTLSSDDPAFLHVGGFDESGRVVEEMGEEAPMVSLDYWQVANAFDRVDLLSLADMARNSVLHAIFPGGVEERERRLKEWDRLWDEYCTWIYNEWT
ncbi:hypothetical protein HK101_001351, partial [Irineochytrium annulatum]